MTIEPNQEQQDKQQSLSSQGFETTSSNSSELLKLQENNFIIYQKFVERTQWFLGTIITLVSIVFIASVGFFGFIQWDFQKTLKADIEKEINERLGKKQAEPELEILGINNQALKDSEVRVKRIIIKENKTGGKKLPFSQVAYQFPLIFKNVGEGNLDFARLTFYSNDLEFDRPSSDQPKYRGEITYTFSSGDDAKSPFLFGGEIGTSLAEITELRSINQKTTNNQVRLPNGKYNILMVIKYPEKSKNKEMNFIMVIDNKTEIIDFMK
jgi:hypothetical protein